ncbi:uncharacterized protein EI97DRAFT_225296 [Westerdykella ornata]|uniref:Uncharacterized protein n=1 Tax=Westerdykella ornata TaxID=318751 RepID=A0A6A6JR37_WESOR|nr:uncharacterized protein EI97DRAFT_225296 [Westerdykella ornata]KAF2279012.1 hypothetical protein EI97DRAFT_225296 [Westerdykella ornata]
MEVRWAVLHIAEGFPRRPRHEPGCPFSWPVQLPSRLALGRHEGYPSCQSRDLITLGHQRFEAHNARDSLEPVTRFQSLRRLLAQWDKDKDEAVPHRSDSMRERISLSITTTILQRRIQLDGEPWRWEGETANDQAAETGCAACATMTPRSNSTTPRVEVYLSAPASIVPSLAFFCFVSIAHTQLCLVSRLSCICSLPFLGC